MSIEMQFSKHDYARKFAARPVVSGETIEAWMAAGVLTPDETTGASKILSLLHQQRMGKGHACLHSRPLDAACRPADLNGPLERPAGFTQASPGVGRLAFRWLRIGVGAAKGGLCRMAGWFIRRG